MALVLAAAGSLAADEAPIGLLNLTYSTGFQEVTFDNFTGVDYGCQGLGSFSVCNGVTITNWTLTISFINENPGDPNPSYPTFTSPLVKNWTGAADDIGHYDPSLNFGSGFTGGLSGTWEIPLSFGNSDEPPCLAADTSSPSCDYQITQVEFSGTISAVDTPFKLGLAGTYDGGNPATYTIFTPVSTFDAVWNVPQADYYCPQNSQDCNPDPSYFGDPNGFTVTVSDQAVNATVPEPGAFALTGSILVAVLWKKRRTMHAAVRSRSDTHCYEVGLITRETDDQRM